MSIISAMVEANGWVLRLVVSGSPGSFAAYTLDPDGTPRVTLTTSHAGYAPSGGQAVSAPLARSFVATKPLRKPVSWDASGTILPATIDETDNGNGTITCRLALAEWVYATDSALALAVAAGWRTGESAASAIAVTNASTRVAPLPIMRWADAVYQVQGGNFRLSLLVASHHPVGLAPVAGVRFSVTDGTTVKTYWTTALGTDNSYGDALRCYYVDVTPAMATALTAGLLRCDAEVYPWLGAMRSTDAAGTRSMTGLGTAGYGDGAQSPFVVGYDPAGTRYSERFLYVDPAGTVTANAAMVQASHAAAKGLAPASRPANITTAIQALYLANKTLAAANGQAAQTRAVDGARIRLAVGTHAGVGATAVTSGVTSLEIPLVIEGDPDDASPRSNCILQTATPPTGRVTRYALRNLVLETGTTTLISSALYWHLDNIEVRGKSGQTTNTVAPFGGTVPASQFNMTATRTKWWKTGSRLAGASMRHGLLRACEGSRKAEALCIARHRRIPATEDTTMTGIEDGVSSWSGLTTAASGEDWMVAYNDLRSCNNRVIQIQPVPQVAAGTVGESYRRAAIIGNVCETIGAQGQPQMAMGEVTVQTQSYNIIEGNSFVGERCTLMYGRPTPTTLAECDSQVTHAFVNRVANNSFDWVTTKHDDVSEPTTQSIRAANGVSPATGYRPQMVETWGILYGVGWEGNYDFGRHVDAASGNFRHEYMGRRSARVAPGLPGYVDDRSSYSATPTGGGNYQPPLGGVLSARGIRSSMDKDRLGTARGVPFTTGGVEVPGSAGLVSLAPASNAVATRAAVTLLGWVGALAPVSTRSGQAVQVTALGWAGALVPTPARTGQRAALTLLGWAGALVPAAARSVQAARTPGVGWTGALAPLGGRSAHSGLATVLTFTPPGIGLAPSGAVHAIVDAVLLLFPGSGAAVVPTLHIPADLRTITITLN